MMDLSIKQPWKKLILQTTKSKLEKKIVVYSGELIFGILAGLGLFFITNSLITLIVNIFPRLINSSFLIYSVIYLFFLAFTILIYTRGWFKWSYLISSLGLYLTLVYVKLFGGI